MELRKVLKGLGLIVLVVALVWLAVISRWLITHRVPNTLDIFLYLIGLPLLLIAIYLIVSKLATTVKQRFSSPTTSHEELTQTENPDEDPSLRWQLPFIALEFLLPQGDSPDAIIAACKDSKRPSADIFKNSHNTPLMTADISDIDAASINDSLLANNSPLAESHQRNLAIAEKLVIRLLDKHFDTLQSHTVSNDEHAQTSPVLQIDWVLPTEWSDDHCALAKTWLLEQLSAYGWSSQTIQVVARSLPPKGHVLLEVDKLNLAYHEARLQLPRLLLVSDSTLDKATIKNWEQTQDLYQPNNPEGLIPSEGAAALLVVPKSHPVLKHRQSTGIGRVFSEARDKDVRQPQRLQADTLVALAQQAIQFSSPEKPPEDTEDEVEWRLVSNTDLRPSRISEALHFAFSLLPEQDPIESVYTLGAANGSAKHILPLASLAIAHYECENEELTTLAFCHHDSVQRYVVKVSPLLLAPKTSPALTV